MVYHACHLLKLKDLLIFLAFCIVEINNCDHERSDGPVLL
jgi:hypothetical protein